MKTFISESVLGGPRGDTVASITAQIKKADAQLFKAKQNLSFLKEQLARAKAYAKAKAAKAKAAK
jgi:hypothetical protein